MCHFPEIGFGGALIFEFTCMSVKRFHLLTSQVSGVDTFWKDHFSETTFTSKGPVIGLASLVDAYFVWPIHSMRGLFEFCSRRPMKGYHSCDGPAELVTVGQVLEPWLNKNTGPYVQISWGQRGVKGHPRKVLAHFGGCWAMNPKNTFPGP